MRRAHVPGQGQDPAEGAHAGGHPQPGAGVLTSPGDLDDIGDRIEARLDHLRASVDPAVYDDAETLVRLVSDLYGAGLSRVVELAQRHSPELLGALATDEIVAPLLALHDLHPEPLRDRVEAALASVRPMLAGHHGDVELLDLDEAAGAVRLRLLGSCDGCPSSTATLQNAVERAVVDAAPEIQVVDVDQPSDEPSAAVPNGGPVPVRLSRKPVYDACPSELATT